MLNISKYVLAILSLMLCATGRLAAQEENIVEVTGKVTIEGSTEPIGGIVVSLVGTERGMITNSNGMFSIIMKRGQKLKFESDGFKPHYYTLPNSIGGKYHTITVPIVIDTIYLNEYVFKQMTPEEFDFAFKYQYIPDEMLMASRGNMSKTAQDILTHTMQRSGAENQSLQQMSNYLKYGNEYGQQNMSNLGNPYAWRDFIDAWKRGDFKGKKR